MNYEGERVTVIDSAGEFAGEGILSDQSHGTWREVRVGPRIERVSGPEVIDVKICFLGFASRELQDAAERMAKRHRVAPPRIDLVLEDGARLVGCAIAGFFGGPLGERWYGISLGERVEADQAA